MSSVYVCVCVCVSVCVCLCVSLCLCVFVLEVIWEMGDRCLLSCAFDLVFAGRLAASKGYPWSWRHVELHPKHASAVDTPIFHASLVHI